MRADTESLESRIGYRFAGRELLRRALTHSSHAYELQLAHAANGDASAPESGPENNEQLEFLGDSVLGFLVSELLVARYPDYREGRLSQLKHHLVSARHLYTVAQALELGQYLQLGRSEEMSGGREKKTLLANAVEALIAAVYLDGGVDAARAFVMHEVFRPPEESPQADPLVGDFKGALQELARTRNLPSPRYVVVAEQGPQHSKTFTVEVRLGGEWAGRGSGVSKKSAAQEAARMVYDQLREPASSGL